MELVVFNALQTSLSGGIGRYSYELSKELYLKNPHKVKIVIREEDKAEFNFAKKEDLMIIKGIENGKQRNYYEQFKLPKEVYSKYPNAILHYPDSMAPLFAKNDVIITVHDIAFKSLKNVFTWKTKMWKNFTTFFSLKKAKKVIAITEFTKSEVVKFYKTNSKKIDVVYNGFNDFSKTEINEKNIKKEILNISKPYIFTVNTISPRKNIDGIIRSFNETKDSIKENLVIAGAKGWMYESVFALVDELNLKDRVIFTDKVNDDELKYLYKNSKAYIYLSFYEGFGLSPLEAMSYGIPCLVSNTSSLPEVVGNSAIQVDPKDAKKVAEKLKSIIEDEEVRDKLIQKGYERTKKFSWGLCAEETMLSYKNK